jgi:hypothetical protein
MIIHISQYPLRHQTLDQLRIFFLEAIVCDLDLLVFFLVPEIVSDEFFKNVHVLLPLVGELGEGMLIILC